MKLLCAIDRVSLRRDRAVVGLVSPQPIKAFDPTKLFGELMLSVPEEDADWFAERLRMGKAVILTIEDA